MSILDDFSNVTSFSKIKDYYLTKQEMKSNAMENLKNLRSLSYGNPSDVYDEGILTNLKELGISNYESFIAASDLENSTITKYLGGSKLGSSISDASNLLMPIIDTASTLTSLTAQAYVADTFNNSLNFVPPSALDSTIGTKDPISGDVDTSQRFYNIAERCGFVQNKVLSVGYSREYIFTTRPTLASDESGKIKSYCFITRPSLNLVYKNDKGEYRSNPSLVNYPSLYALVNTDVKLYAELCRENCDKSNLFYLLSNYVKEVPPIRLVETERNGIENMYKFSTPIAGVPEYHNLEVTLTMNDNYRADIAKLLYAVSEYRHNVSKRGLAPRPEYSKYNADDTLVSMYIVTVNQDMEIIGFGVGLNGVISDVPTHFTQHRAGGFNKDEILDNFNFTIKFSTFYPYKPQYFDIFNFLFEFDPLNMVNVKGYTPTLMAPGRETDSNVKSSNYKSSIFGDMFGVDDSGFGEKLNNLTQTTQNAINKVTGAITSAQSKINQYSKYIDNVKAMATSVDSYQTIKSILGNGTVPSSPVFYSNTNYNYKEYFEYLAKRPGVYVAISDSELETGKRSHRLGFSY